MANLLYATPSSTCFKSNAIGGSENRDIFVVFLSQAREMR